MEVDFAVYRRMWMQVSVKLSRFVQSKAGDGAFYIHWVQALRQRSDSAQTWYLK